MNLLRQINNLTDNDNSEDENPPNCKYQDTSYFTNHITKGMKSKALSLFHLNVGSFPKQFDNFTYLINQLQIKFDFIGITESRSIKGQRRIQACFDSIQPLWAPKKTAQIFLQVQINNHIFR